MAREVGCVRGRELSVSGPDVAVSKGCCCVAVVSEVLVLEPGVQGSRSRIARQREKKRGRRGQIERELREQCRRNNERGGRELDGK
jgi:hypothetical protein